MSCEAPAKEHLEKVPRPLLHPWAGEDGRSVGYEMTGLSAVLLMQEFYVKTGGGFPVRSREIHKYFDACAHRIQHDARDEFR